MKILVTTLAIALSIGTAYAAIHPQTDLPWSAKGYLTPPASFRIPLTSFDDAKPAPRLYDTKPPTCSLAKAITNSC